MAHVDIENLLEEAIGLDSTSVGSATIESAVRLRMTALGINETDEYCNKLRNSEEELQELIESVVVPETWFFRDQEAFTALTRLITQEWLPHHPNATLRVLSGPCCTGEEPYSMVMQLLDAGLSPDRLRVDAVDISMRALTRARRGVYGQHSFRGEQLSFRDRYFDKVGKGYRLPEWLRKIVNFQQRNLLSPGFGMDVLPYDVIFCRNVLIYFGQSTQRRVLKTLADLLTSTGYLFVGPAEAFLVATSGFTSLNQSMSFAFRKSVGLQDTPVRIPHPMFVKAIKTTREERPKSKDTAPGVQDPVQIPGFPTGDVLDKAKRLADAGRLAEACELCEIQLKQSGPSFEIYYLLGLARDSMGDPEIAAQCYRKTLYLEPKHYEALVHLALVSERLGDKATAQKLHERACRVAKENGE